MSRRIKEIGSSQSFFRSRANCQNSRKSSIIGSSELFLDVAVAVRMWLHFMVQDTLSTGHNPHKPKGRRFSAPQNVTLTDTVPVGMQFVEASAGQGTCQDVAPTVVNNLVSLAPSQEITTQIALRVSAPGSFINRVDELHLDSIVLVAIIGMYH